MREAIKSYLSRQGPANLDVVKEVFTKTEEEVTTGPVVAWERLTEQLGPGWVPSPAHGTEAQAVRRLQSLVRGGHFWAMSTVLAEQSRHHFGTICRGFQNLSN